MCGGRYCDVWRCGTVVCEGGWGGVWEVATVCEVVWRGVVVVLAMGA